MTVKRTIASTIFGQFRQPRGAGGEVVGWIMAHRSSNVQRSRWAVGLLDVQPGERVLEIGFGPGRAIAELSRHAGPTGHVYGIDHSAVMLRQATSRNAAAIAAGQVTLSLASVDRLPVQLQGPLDAILTVNSLAFWPGPAERLTEFGKLLRPGGRIAVASQPRHTKTPTATSDAARAIDKLLTEAGYVRIRTETLALSPAAACVLGTRP
jgi:ubiquinone/menaquinone biosynthesis C-methylase UbiE